MNQLVKIQEERNVKEDNGKHIYNTNDHFRRLANVMEHPEFREFYEKYMTDWDSAKTMIMFMKTYEAIEKHAKIELTPYQKISIVKELIDDPDKRRMICEGFSHWTLEDKDKNRLSL